MTELKINYFHGTPGSTSSNDISPPSQAKPAPHPANFVTDAGGAPKAKTNANTPKGNETPPIRREFRDAIAERESAGHGNNGYSARHPLGALGRYQLTEIVRKDIGLQNDNGVRNQDVYGVSNEEEFLASPAAQDKAFENYMRKNEKYLSAKGALQFVGQDVSGIKANFKITRSGLLAAAHRRGAGAVSQYLKNMNARSWKSDPKMSETDYHVETRLREFADVPYDQ